MTRSPLLCCTSIIRSSPLVQASSSLSMICARAWPTGATRQRNPFPPFFARVFLHHDHVCVTGRDFVFDLCILTYFKQEVINKCVSSGSGFSCINLKFFTCLYIICDLNKGTGCQVLRSVSSLRLANGNFIAKVAFLVQVPKHHVSIRSFFFLVEKP